MLALDLTRAPPFHIPFWLQIPLLSWNFFYLDRLTNIYAKSEHNASIVGAWQQTIGEIGSGAACHSLYHSSRYQNVVKMQPRACAPEGEGTISKGTATATGECKTLLKIALQWAESDSQFEALPISGLAGVVGECTSLARLACMHEPFCRPGVNFELAKNQDGFSLS